MTYTNIALIPVDEEQIEAYRALSEQLAEVWMEHGALVYREYVGVELDVDDKGAVGFPQALELEEGETVLLAAARFESKAHRDQVEAKVIEDPRVGEIMSAGVPFDPSRIVGGGFELLVEG